MKQADLQRMRRVLADQITNLHSDKLWIKDCIRNYWADATPDTVGGIAAFKMLNEYKEYHRQTSKKIEKLSILIKELKKEERKILGH